MKQIVDRAEAYLAAAGHHDHGTGRLAVVFDIDDTLLNTYDYTLAEQFGYSPATNEIWVDNAAFPAVFYMRSWSGSPPATATPSSLLPAGRSPRPRPRSRT
jgi:hypothetical protein